MALVYFVTGFVIAGAVVAFWILARLWVHIRRDGTAASAGEVKPDETLLTMYCCFCNHPIHKDERVVVGSMHTCSQCDSRMEALPPKGNTQTCGIGRWESRCA